MSFHNFHPILKIYKAFLATSQALQRLLCLPSHSLHHPLQNRYPQAATFNRRQVLTSTPTAGPARSSKLLRLTHGAHKQKSFFSTRSRRRKVRVEWLRNSHAVEQRRVFSHVAISGGRARPEAETRPTPKNSRLAHGAADGFRVRGRRAGSSGFCCRVRNT